MTTEKWTEACSSDPSHQHHSHDEVLVSLSGSLWDEVVDSIATDHPGQRLDRNGRWEGRKVGFGWRLEVEVDVDTAAAIARYLESKAALLGQSWAMDSADRPSARHTSQMALKAATAIRAQIDGG